MAAFMGTIQLVLSVVLPIGAFLLMRRRPHHTRLQLIAAAALGGGLGGAIVALLAGAGGASLSDAVPWAVLGLVSGSVVGVVGVAALAFGAWLNREP